jgi:hypothetical protein
MTSPSVSFRSRGTRWPSSLPRPQTRVKSSFSSESLAALYACSAASYFLPKTRSHPVSVFPAGCSDTGGLANGSSLR